MIVQDAQKEAMPAIKRTHKKTSFKVGDRVVRNKAVGGPGTLRGDVVGTILKITPAPGGAGGTRARVRVRWDNGHEASVEDRQLLLVKQGPR
jgi:hypothetical protein